MKIRLFKLYVLEICAKLESKGARSPSKTWPPEDYYQCSDHLQVGGINIYFSYSISVEDFSLIHINKNAKRDFYLTTRVLSFMLCLVPKSTEEQKELKGKWFFSYLISIYKR